MCSNDACSMGRNSFQWVKIGAGSARSVLVYPSDVLNGRCAVLCSVCECNVIINGIQLYGTNMHASPLQPRRWIFFFSVPSFSRMSCSVGDFAHGVFMTAAFQCSNHYIAETIANVSAVSWLMMGRTNFSLRSCLCRM